MNKEIIKTVVPLSARWVKKQQIVNLLCLFLISLGIGLVLYLSVKPNLKKISEQMVSTEFANPLKHVDGESALFAKSEAQWQAMQKHTQAIQQKLDQLSAENANQNFQERYKKILDRLQGLEHQLVKKDKIPLQAKMRPEILFHSVAPSSSEISYRIREDFLTHDSLVELQENSKAKKTIASYIPAGTFVKAIMLGGADASAAVNATANPTPMLFRILEEGTLPNHQKSHLKGCIATAAVVGDISSERGFVRLESLSCVIPHTQEILDQAVEGTVFGSDGKNGIRGKPIWREGALLQRAFAAGTLSGFASGLSDRYTHTSTSSLGTTTQSVEGKDIFKYGLATGTGHAMEKLANYNIERAEQYHPVIQLSAGTVVDLVFLKGFYLQKAVVHSEKRSLSSSSKNDSNLFQLTQLQMDRLKERQKSLGFNVS